MSKPAWSGKDPFYTRIRPRLFILVLAAFLPALVLILYQGHQHGKLAAEHSIMEARHLLQITRAEFGQSAEETRRLFDLLGQRLAAHRLPPAACATLLAGAMPVSGYYSNLGVAAPNGDLYCSALPPKGKVAYRDRLWFRRALETRAFTIGDVVIGHVIGKPLIAFAQPHYDSRGRLEAIYFAGFDIGWFQRFFEHTDLPPGSTVTLLDQNGVVMGRSVDADKWIGRKYKADIARVILTARREGAGEGLGLDGVRRLYAFAPLYTIGEAPAGYVSIGIPAHLATAGVRAVLVNAVAGITITLALVLAIAWFGGDYFLLKKIRVLTDTVQRLARGERARSGIADMRGEIGVLARAFDDMADIVETRGGEIRRINELLEKIFDTTHFLIAYLDRDFNFIRVNKAYADAGRRAPEFFVGKNHFALYPGAEAEAIFRRVVEAGEPYTAFARPFEYPEQPERGVTYWDWTLSPVRDADGRVGGMIFGLVEVTERVKAEQQTAYLRLHDALTGLPNRALLLDRLKQAVIEARRHGREVAVLCLDIDRFKFVNEAHGHVTGDTVLKAAAARLTGCVRPGDTVARLGGDEFAVALTDVAHPDDVGKVVQKIMRCADEPLVAGDNPLYVTLSVGITLFPLDGDEPETLLKNAAVAMYQAKQQGGHGYQYYSTQMATAAAEHLALENSLRLALERQEFLLHYQPQVNLQTGQVTGVEALIRWRHPQNGLVPPAKFIPLAEETRLIVPIGEWVLRTACTQARAWREEGLPALRVAVNISAQHFKQPGLDETIRRILQETGAIPGGWTSN